MLIKYPAVLFTSSNAISSGLTCCNAPPRPQCCRAPTTATTPQYKRRRRPAQARLYATVNDDTRQQPRHPDHPAWPDLGSSLSPPTPYQIFNQQRDEPYSKRRFYELVKLYHPDRHKHIDSSTDPSHPSNCSPVVLLERYRLVIAANAILSDPSKREAYDRFGAGWNLHDVVDLAKNGNYSYKYSTYHRWRTDGSAAYQWPPDQDPMFNATWEDWERWYRQQYAHERGSSSSSWSNFYSSKGPRRPLYASNQAFISAVFILAALGGVGQATRVQDSNRWRLERTQVMSDRASASLMQARQDTLDRKDDGETKDKRIKRFLSTHDDYDPDEFDGRALREGDEGLCAGGAVSSRDEPKFWQKPPDGR